MNQLKLLAVIRDAAELELETLLEAMAQELKGQYEATLDDARKMLYLASKSLSRD